MSLNKNYIHTLSNHLNSLLSDYKNLYISNFKQLITKNILPSLQKLNAILEKQGLLYETVFNKTIINCLTFTNWENVEQSNYVLNNLLLSLAEETTEE